MKDFLLLVFSLSCFNCLGQVATPDRELDQLLDSAHHYRSNHEKAYHFLEQADSVLSDCKCPGSKARLNFQKGNFYKQHHKYNEGINAYFSALAWYDQHPDSSVILKIYNGLGVIFRAQGNSPEALKFFLKSQQLAQKIRDERQVAAAIHNIGMIYSSQHNYAEALNHFYRALRMNEESLYSPYLIQNLNALGHVHMNKPDQQLDSAISYFNRAIAIADTAGIRGQIPLFTMNKSLAQKAKGDLKAATSTLEGIISDKTAMADPLTRIYVYNNYADVLFLTGRIRESIQMASDVLLLSRDLGLPELEITSLKTLSKSHEKAGNFKEAFRYQSLEHSLSDSMNALMNNTRVIEMQTRYETANKEQEIEKLKATDIARQTHTRLLEEENRSKEYRMRFYLAALGLLLAVAFYIFYVARKSRKQNKLISQQKAIVEARNREVLDSMKYARRIQQAILPSAHSMKKLPGDHFLIYLPKDIVAGDFYWVEESGGKIFFAVADCTGHGVPGALVSIVCANALRQCLREMNLTDPGAILDHASAIVEQHFRGSAEMVRDGMDIALCSFDLITRRLTFSGANRSLFIVMPGEAVQTKEIKGNKQPVGIHEDKIAFTSHRVTLTGNEMIYLFSDGFADQFGGQKLKKLKTGNFKQLLKEHAHLPCPDQKAKLEQFFTAWKKDTEQIDDVCVMGLRMGDPK